MDNTLARVHNECTRMSFLTAFFAAQRIGDPPRGSADGHYSNRPPKAPQDSLALSFQTVPAAPRLVCASGMSAATKSTPRSWRLETKWRLRASPRGVKPLNTKY